MRRKPAVISSLGGFMIGLVTLTNTLSRPRLADVHTVDILSLVGAGLCFGAGLTALIAAIRGGRDRTV